MFGIFRKFWLLIWKNMLLRRRHWIVTTFEILLPTICASILAYSNKQLFAVIEESVIDIGALTSSDGPTIKIINERVYDTMPEDALIRGLTICLSHAGGCPYAPGNVQTNRIMQEMQSFLRSHGVFMNFFPVKNEKEIENMLIRQGLQSKHKNKFDAAIVFENGFPISGDKKDKTVSYKIRLKYSYSSFLSSKVGQPIMPVDDTEKLFPDEVLDPWSHYGELQKRSYVDSGFIALQISLDLALIKEWTEKTITDADKIAIQAFPIPKHAKRDEKITLAYLFHSMVLPTFLVLGFIFIIPAIMLGVVSERETGIRELLKMNGVPGWLQWIGWLVNSLIIQSLSVTIVIGLLFIDIIKYGDPGVWYFILVLYMISATSFCFLLSSFFIRPILATIVGIILWLVSYFPVFAIFELYAGRVTLEHKLWACLSPNVAFYLAVKIMMTYERDGVGVQWDNIAKPLSPGHHFSLGYIIMMLCANSTLFMILTFYLENVLSTEFGVRRPFYYIFLPSTWGIRCKSKVAPKTTSDANENSKPGFEPEPTNTLIGIHLENLRKIYDRKKVAVDNITLNTFKGEIFVLLGHNGAGKTTTISMLTGLCAPSGGTAQVNGLDISRDLDKVRQNLGLCPQQNMLFDKLTVSEHLTFFGRLKGLKGKDANWRLQELMMKLQLWEKKDTLSQHLSGGQKRKLHLGIALIGNTGVLVLDEPTSGMDPEARRAIWDVLLEVRGERTILLTTHFMEEADVLGDRIAIMASGKIQCCGTSSFLKKYYGSGYTLKLTLITATLSRSESQNQSVVSLPIAQQSSSVHSQSRIDVVNKDDIVNILEFVRKYVPNAFLKEKQSGNVAEVFITLPTEDASTAALAKLFTDLPGVKEKWGIRTVGMSHTTVDEVFLRVGELQEGAAVEDDVDDVPVSFINRQSPKLLRLIMIQFMALLMKKILYTYRKRKLILAQIIVPVLLLIGAILSCNGFFAPYGHPQSVTISLNPYKRPVTPIIAALDDAYQDLASVIGGSANRLRPINPKATLSDELLKIANRSLEQYNNFYIVGAEYNSEFNKVLYSTVPNHAGPLAINIGSNTILRQLGYPEYRIQVTNHPFRADTKLVIGSVKPAIEHIFYATVLFEVFMPIGLALLAATFIVLPMEEKLCKAKQLQMMTILNPMIYWGASFVWDFFIVFVVVVMMICCFPIFQSHEMYTSYGGHWVAFLILMVYGYCAIFFSYLMSHFAKTVLGGFAFVTVIHIISGLILGIVVSSLDMLVVFGSESSTRIFLQFVGRLFPTYGAVISTTRYVEAAIENGRCNILTGEVEREICGNFLNILNSKMVSQSEIEYLECCDVCKLLIVNRVVGNRGSKSRDLYSPIPECFEPKPYILWENPRQSLAGDIITVPGIAQELFFMLMMSGVFQMLLMAMEYRHWINEIVEGLLLKCGPYRRRRPTQVWGGVNYSPEGDDDDVVEEAKRMAEIVQFGQLSEDALIVLGMRKIFEDYTAVRQISFGVHYGECFGLLGVNGAGKTTTFRMLTGDETPTDGLVYAFAKSIKRDRRKYLSSIGYCPQFDGIIGVLTGMETLKLFCSLRGISGSMGNAEAVRWLKKLGLHKSGKEQCRKYSGGMKRRLCAAIAMIGDPMLILLDEPTSGVDPVSRRQFWKVLQSVRNSGQAIILTSHSMEECEALCSRLAIMVNGRLQCLGGVQHLKNKFAQGYSLSLKMKPSISVDSENFVTLNEQITERFQPCTVKDKHNNFIQYEISNTSLSWEFLFKTMEELKLAHEELIEDYSVNETTLEEVFLSFARKQYGDRHGQRNGCCCCRK